MLNIAVIGYGGRINSVVSDLVKTGKVKLAAVMDIDNDAVKKNYIDKNGFEGVRYYTDADEMIATERPDGVLIGTRCSTHTHYALLVAKYSIPMFLEKPVCTTYEDLERLRGIPHMNDKTVVSFPLRMSQLVEYVKGIVDSGKLGRIEHVQAYNNVPYARGYYHKWYRDESETGGLFLQKATHDLDYINYILGFRPVRVCAMTSKQIFKGDKPAGLKCADCPDADSCPESPANVLKVDSSRQPGEYCCFAVDTGNEDSGSAIIEYDTGMHVVYSQDFIVRNSAGKRGARLIGYKGTLEFDWYSDVVTVYNHMQNSVEHHTLAKTLEGHFGGDAVLERNFIAVMEGRERSVAPLSDGILSAELCLAARRSAKEHVFVDISD